MQTADLDTAKLHWNSVVSTENAQYMCLDIKNCNVHQVCWPTSSRHARLSAACLVGATSDNNLNDGSNGLSIKTEIMSLRLAEEMIFGLRARSCANRVGV